MLHTSEYQKTLITQYKKSEQSMHMRVVLDISHQNGNEYIINMVQAFLTNNSYFLYYIDNDYKIAQREQVSLASEVVEEGAPRGIRFQITERAKNIALAIDANHILYDGKSMIIIINGIIESLNRGTPVSFEHMSETFYERARAHNKVGSVSNEQTATLLAHSVATKPAKTGRVQKKVEPLLFAQMKEWTTERQHSLPLLLIGALGRVFKHDFVDGHVQIGTVVDLRTRPSEQAKLGLGINTIPVTMPTNETTVDGYFTALKKQYFASLAHMYVPQTVRGYKPELLFSYQQPQLLELEAGSVSLDWQPIEQSDIPIAFTFFDYGTDGEIYLEYDERMYTAQQMANKMARLCTLLETITSGTVATLPDHVLTEADIEMVARLQGREQHIEDINAYDVILHKWEAAPADKPMVIYKDKPYTYRAVMDKVHRLAAVLEKTGIQPGDYIGIQVDLPLHNLIAILASWQRGAIFVPLATSLPEARVEYITEQANISFIIDEQMLSSLDTGTMINGVGRRRRVEDASARAYVIFTSGTSGTPKGCIQTHRNLLNIAGDNTMALDDESTFLQAMNTTFDVSLMGIVALMCGATTILQDTVEISSATKTMANIEKYNVTALNTTTALFETWVPTHIATLKKVSSLMVGGEALKQTTVAAVFDDLKGRLINGYGPTETTIYSLTHRIHTYTEDVVPIGKPIANTSVRILNTAYEDVGIGELGELAILGAGLGAGYIGDTATTDEKFCLIDGKRTYMTGDLCYVDFAGQIIFCGRKDEQVKVSGFRIDPVEVARYIEQVEGVRQAAVFKDGSRLVAVYTTDDRAVELDATTFDAYLRTYLPKYMMPRTYVALEQFAFTPNGKLDYRRLQEAVGQHAQEGDETDYDIATLVPNEREIIGSWEKVLHAKPRTKTTSLAAAGATSLEVISLYAELQNAFVEEIPFDEFDETQSVTSIARRLQTVRLDEVQVGEETENESARTEITNMQRNIFLEYVKHGASTKYNVPALVRLNDLDVDKFKYAVKKLATELQDLHVNFHLVDDAIQVERRGSAFAQLQCIHVDTVEDCVGHIKPFDLGMDELIRLFLFTCNGEHYFLLDSHHIVMDGVSMNVIMQRLDELYIDATSKVEQTPSFARYVAFEKAQDKNKADAYWQTELRASEKYKLLTDTKTNGGRGEQKTKRATLSGLMRQLKGKDIDVNTYLLMAIGFCIALQGGVKKQFVGLTMSSRIRAEFAHMKGLLVNTVPFVYDYDALTGKSFQDLYTAVYKQIKRAAVHQFTDFNALMRKMQLVEDQAVFDVLVNIREAFEPLQVGTFMTADGIIEQKFPLNIECVKQTDDIEVIYEYDGARFDEAEVTTVFEGLIATMQRLHECMSADNIYTSIASIYKESNEVAIASVRQDDISVSAAFYDHVLASPAAVAVETTTEQITYRQLYNMSAHLADRLQSEYGVAAGDRIGLSFTKGPEMIVAMLAAAFCGAVYVPLNLTFPAAMKKALLDITKVKHVLGNTDDGLVDMKLRRSDLETTRLGDVITSKPFAQDASAPLYILFTSGTTGTPKGIEVKHHSVTNLVRNNFTAKSKEKSILFSDYSFDGSVYDIYITLLNGGTLFITDHANIVNPDVLCELIAARNIQTCFIPAAYFNALTDAQYEKLQGVDALFVGGEKLSLPHMKRAFKYLAGKLWNGYGPTETTVFGATKQITQGNLDEGLIPIGRPLQGVHIAVVDRWGNILPPYAIGELVITGAGLSNGYINAESYAFSKGGTSYASGDVGYCNQVGEIIYLGRKQETQVKYRGYRIELEAIEATILASGCVTNACVRFDTDEQRLSMFLVTAERAFDVGALVAYLRAHVPDYMIPPFYAVVEALPLNKNGKIDRTKLATYTMKSIHDAVSEENDVLLPQDELTQGLVVVWQQVLDVRTIDMRSNFFDLGGYSLQAMKIVSRLKQSGIELAIQDVTDYPVFGDFCDHVKHVYSKNLIENQKDEFYALADTVQIKTINNVQTKVQVIVLPTYMLNFAYYMIFEVMTKKYPNYIEWNICNFATEKNFIEKYALKINDIIKPNKQILLLGYSFGGCFAYEVANILINKYNRRIDGVIILDSYFKTTYDTGLEFFMDDLRRQDVFRQKLIEFFPTYGELETDIQDGVEKTFLGFMRNTVTLENKKYNLDTTLHFLEAEFQEHGLTDTRNEWFEGCFVRTEKYVAFGQHNDMLNEENVDQNFNIITKIIEKEVEK